MRVIKNPHYTNNARTSMACEFHYDDGRVLKANITNVDGKNPDWIEIHTTFSKEELEKNTLNNIRKVNEQREREALSQRAMEEKKRQAELYKLKMEAFDIQTIKDSTHKKLKAQIRKAKTPFEVSAFTSALIIHEYTNTTTETAVTS